MGYTGRLRRSGSDGSSVLDTGRTDPSCPVSGTSYSRIRWLLTRFSRSSLVGDRAHAAEEPPRIRAMFDEARRERGLDPWMI